MREDFYEEYFRIEDRHWWFVGRRRIFLALLDRYLGRDTSPDRRLLDIGCGTGTMLRHLARYGRVDGIDADPAAVRFCEERGISTVQQAETPPIPHPDGLFDLVTAFDVLEHVDSDSDLLAEIRRVLVPGGVFVASVPAFRFLWGNQDEISHHRRRYTAAMLRGRFAAAGLELERISYFNMLLFPPIAAIRLYRRVFMAQEEAPHSDFEMTSEGRVNDALARLLGAEARMLVNHDLPFGVSILGIARAPAAHDSSSMATAGVGTMSRDVRLTRAGS